MIKFGLQKTSPSERVSQPVVGGYQRGGYLSLIFWRGIDWICTRRWLDAVNDR